MTKVKRAAAEASVSAEKPSTKIAVAEALLRRPEGATMEQLVAATGWQAHSMRGAMSGNLKKKRGLVIASTKVDGVRTYRIAAEAAA